MKKSYKQKGLGQSAKNYDYREYKIVLQAVFKWGICKGYGFCFLFDFKRMVG